MHTCARAHTHTPSAPDTPILGSFAHSLPASPSLSPAPLYTLTWSGKPFLTQRKGCVPLLCAYLTQAPQNALSLLETWQQWVSHREWRRRQIRKSLGCRYKTKVYRWDGTAKRRTKRNVVDGTWDDRTWKLLKVVVSVEESRGRESIDLWVK